MNKETRKKIRSIVYNAIKVDKWTSTDEVMGVAFGMTRGGVIKMLYRLKEDGKIESREIVCKKTDMICRKMNIKVSLWRYKSEEDKQELIKSLETYGLRTGTNCHGAYAKEVLKILDEDGESSTEAIAYKLGMTGTKAYSILYRMRTRGIIESNLKVEKRSANVLNEGKTTYRKNTKVTYWRLPDEILDSNSVH